MRHRVFRYDPSVGRVVELPTRVDDEPATNPTRTPPSLADLRRLAQIIEPSRPSQPKLAPQNRCPRCAGHQLLTPTTSCVSCGWSGPYLDVVPGMDRESDLAKRFRKGAP